MVMMQEGSKTEVLRQEHFVSGYFCRHKVLVREEFFDGDKEDLCHKVSGMTGYSPYQYGLYNIKVVSSSKQDEYIVSWETDLQ